MLFPTTYLTALLLMILSMLCWGSWANATKLTNRKWRFELFYIDYSVGVLLAALIAAFTFGSTASSSSVSLEGGLDFGFVDNLLVALKRYLAYALASGAVFNLANMLLVAAIAVAGMSVAFPVGIGLALIIGVIWNYILKPQGHPAFLFGGSAVVLGAIVACALAYRSLRATVKTPSPPPRRGYQSGASFMPEVTKGLLLSLGSGLLMGSFYPLLALSQQSDFGLSPYSAGALLAVGVFLTTPVYTLFFINLPVQGEPVALIAYLKGSWKDHLLGVLGGAVWATGLIANLVAAAAPKEVNVGPAVSYAVGQGATLISTLWGLLVWKEFAGAKSKTRLLIALTLVLFVAGLAMVAAAPLFKTK